MDNFKLTLQPTVLTTLFQEYSVGLPSQWGQEKEEKIIGNQDSADCFNRPLKFERISQFLLPQGYLYRGVSELQKDSFRNISRVSNIESDNSQNFGLEDYKHISDGIFPNFTTPSIKITLGQKELENSFKF